MGFHLALYNDSCSLVKENTPRGNWISSLFFLEQLKEKINTKI